MDYIENLSPNSVNNKWNIKAKVLKKGLIEGLKERGFKSSNVSKIIGAAEFIKKLKDQLYCKSFLHPNETEEVFWVRERLDFANPLPISAKYLLGGMTEKGIEKAMNYQKEDKGLSIRVLEDLKKRYPLNPDETRGGRNNQLRKLKRVDDEHAAISIESIEICELSQESKLELFIKVASELDIKSIQKKEDTLYLLHTVHPKLIRLAQLMINKFHNGLSLEHLETLIERLQHPHESLPQQKDRT